MNVQDYCKGMELEMATWKAKLYDVMRKVDQLGSAEKEKVLPNIEDLHMLLEEMSDRVENLRTECPSDWSPVKKEIEEGTIDMPEYKKAIHIMLSVTFLIPIKSSVTYCCFMRFGLSQAESQKPPFLRGLSQLAT